MTFKIIKRMEEVEDVEDIICNRCGKSTRIEGANEGINFSVLWGYHSKRDCDRWTGDLCEECSEAFEVWLESAGGHIDKAMCDLFGDPICTTEEFDKQLDKAIKMSGELQEGEGDESFARYV